MTATSSLSVLITGANAGIGKEVARQLAGRDDVDRIYLACRNPAKAQTAKADLERATGRSIFTVVPMDTTDLGSVIAAVDLIETPLSAVIMNAGGAGGSTPIALTADGVTEIFASNVLGHVVLLERLLARKALTTMAILVGSESARGIPKLGMKRVAFAEHSVAEFVSVIDGSYFAGKKANAGLAYQQVKYLGALWMSDLARRHPDADMRLITMSPGNTAGTDVFNDLPKPLPTLMNRVLMPVVFPRIGLAHPLEVGAKRLVDAVGDFTLTSGVFYGSAANTLTGPLIDQSTIVAEFADPTIAANANEAIHRFIN